MRRLFHYSSDKRKRPLSAIGLVLFLSPLAACDDGETTVNDKGWVVTTSRSAFEKAVEEAWKKPGKNGPVPTGEPGDPFHVVEYRGDDFRMWDSGPDLLGGSKPYWIDDNRVLFIAGTPTRNDSSRKPFWATRFVYVWDLDKGISRFIDRPRAWRLCHAGGFMRVYFKKHKDPDTGKEFLPSLFGEIGDLKENPGEILKRPKKMGSGRTYNSFTCDNANRPDAMEGRAWTPLRAPRRIPYFSEVG